MIIIIKPEKDEKHEPIELHGVSQFAICAVKQDGIGHSMFRRSMVADKNQLLGMILTLKLDVESHDNSSA